MNNAPAFMGEIEFVDDTSPAEDFGRFENLPFIDSIHELAHEFSDHLELMPYQKVGANKKLLISVYVKSKLSGGRVIAVLTRDDYPKDLRALDSMMQLALQRIKFLSHLTHQFDEASIASAEEALNLLRQKMSVQWPDLTLR